MARHVSRRGLLKTTVVGLSAPALGDTASGRPSPRRQPRNTFTVASVDGGPEFEYAFTVPGAVEKGPEAGDNDSITSQSGTTRVTGVVGNGHVDDFRVAAEPTDWSATVATRHYRLLYNGSEIQPPDGTQSSPSFRVDLSQIDADEFPQIDAFVSVRGGAGDPVTGLTARNFAVAEDGTRQTITDVTRVGQSSGELSVVLLLDTSGSMDERIGDAKRGARAFVDTLQSDDEAAVVQYNSTVSTVQEFTSEKRALDGAISSLSADGDTALFDGIEHSLNLATVADGRTAIIVLADGENDADPDNDGHGIDAVVDRATQSGISIYTIGLNTSMYDPVRLRRLATETGGLFFEAADSGELEQIYDDIGRTIAAEYRLRYGTTNDSRDGTERTVTVTARHDGQSRTVTGTYFAPERTGGSVCPTSVQIREGGTGETSIVLRGIEDGFAGGEFLFTVPDVAAPESVSVNQQFGQTDISVSGQDVRMTVSDTGDNFQAGRSEFELGRIRLRGRRDGSGTISVDPVQADDDDGRPITLEVGAGCGEIVVSQATCPTVDGTSTTDPDDDGRCEDLNGNGRRDFDDVNTFFDEIFGNDDVTENVAAFDFNDDGDVDVVDVQALFHEQQEVR